MLQPTGSVYLDRPGPTSRRPQERRVNNTRVVAAGFLATLGLVGLTAAALLGGLRSLIIAPDVLLDTVDATIDEPLARAELEREISTAIETGFIDEQATEIAATYGFDIASESQRISALAIDDEGFRTALAQVITDLHARVVIEPALTDLDLTPLSDAVMVVIERESPELSAIIPPGATLWTLDASAFPDLSGPAGLVDQALMIALIASSGIVVSAALHPRRHRVAAWTGRWALTFGLLCALSAVGLPYLGGRLTGWSTVEVAIRASSLRLLAPAAIAGVVGMGLVSFAAVARHHEKREVIEQGTAAALGINEPQSWRHNIAPALPRPTRDLVDAGRTLTNI